MASLITADVDNSSDVGAVQRFSNKQLDLGHIIPHTLPVYLTLKTCLMRPIRKRIMSCGAKDGHIFTQARRFV